MAIVVEEEAKKSGGLGGVIMWGAIFVILGVAIYYIFFKRPDLVEVHTPANFESTVQLSRIKLNPDAVVNSAQFKALQTYASPLAPQTAGRQNPFLGTF